MSKFCRILIISDDNESREILVFFFARLFNSRGLVAGSRNLAVNDTEGRFHNLEVALLRDLCRIYCT